MPKTTIQTDQAARIAKRLTNHFKHKVAVTETDTGYFVNMAGADVTFTPTDNELHIEYVRNESTDSPERPYDEERLRFVITDHLDRMAGEIFEYHWSE